MSSVLKALHLTDVRCFRGALEAPLTPITVLVGENSSGKSTFMALLRIAWDLAHGEPNPDFNEEPFQLGAYDDIATYIGGRGGLAKTFSIGLRFPVSLPESRDTKVRQNGRNAEDITVAGAFGKASGHPQLRELRVETPRFELTAQLSPDDSRATILIEGSEGQRLEAQTQPESGAALLSLRSFLYALDSSRWPKATEVFASTHLLREEDLSYLDGLLHTLLRAPARPYAMAPTRSKPKRTYDPLRDIPSPEGEHIPMLLARLSHLEPERWKALAASLEAFGKASGLFDSLEVRQFEPTEASPFQLRVNLAGQRAATNIVDVGYGVSQTLPLLVDTLVLREATTFLVQQPEIHLHPRAQAELGSFLCLLKKERRHSFVIETHSDYLIDRIRWEARQGNQISPRDVTFLFFSRDGAFVRTRAIALDESGDLVDAPPDYRQFFLDEQLRVLGLSGPDA